jgi:DNA topoisomerase-2
VRREGDGPPHADTLCLQEYKEYHTDTTVHFIIELNARGMAEVKDQEAAETYFKMHHMLATSNMVLFDQNGKIKKYTTPEEIMEDFYLMRLSYYQKRKVRCSRCPPSVPHH